MNQIGRRLSQRHIDARCLAAGALLWPVAMGIVLGCAVPSGSALIGSESSQRIEGRVIDATTGMPLAGASVIARYKRHSMTPAHSSTVCLRVEYIRTADDGTYRFPVDGDGLPLVDAFRYGFRPASRPLAVQDSQEIVDGQTIVRYHVIRRPASGTDWVNEGSYATRKEAEYFARIDDQYLKPAVGSRAERFAELWDYVSSSGCTNGGETRKIEVPFLRDVEAEMRDLADTPAERERVKLLGRIIESTQTAR